jgi:predicted RNA-binding protein with PIN domain
VKTAAGTTYIPGAMVPPEEPATASIWLVDGFNVLHAGLLRGRDRGRWWQASERHRLVELARRFDDPEAQVWVVFDGPHPPEEPEEAEASGEPGKQRVQVVFAPTADEWLLARLRAAPSPDRIVVVTRDRRLADRCRHRGARVASPREFLAHCGDEE